MESAATYASAKAGCEALATGGKLAAPKTEEISHLLNNFNTEADFWIGLDDE